MRKGLRPLPHFNPYQPSEAQANFPRGGRGHGARARTSLPPRRKPAPRFRSANPLILFRISGDAPPACAGFPVCRDVVIPSRVHERMPRLNPQAGFGSAGSFVIRLACLSSLCRKSYALTLVPPLRSREGSVPRIRAEVLLTHASMGARVLCDCKMNDEAGKENLRNLIPRDLLGARQVPAFSPKRKSAISRAPRIAFCCAPTSHTSNTSRPWLPAAPSRRARVESIVIRNIFFTCRGATFPPACGRRRFGCARMSDKLTRF